MHIQNAFISDIMTSSESHEVPGLDVIFNPESPFVNPFQGLETFHLQTKYYKDHFGLVVSS